MLMRTIKDNLKEKNTVLITIQHQPATISHYYNWVHLVICRLRLRHLILTGLRSKAVPRT